MSTRHDHAPPDDRLPEPGQAPSSDDPERAAKPRWVRPEITSFKPVADAQGIGFRIGDGLNNLS